jgi:hypothetical protein
MNGNRSILIGCSDAASLALILNSIEERSTFRYKIITVLGGGDLNRMILSIRPDLLILSYRNNDQVIGNLCQYIKDQEVPVICIVRKLEELPSTDQHIMFIQPAADIQQSNPLSSTICSIFRLRNLASSVAISSLTGRGATGGKDINPDLSRYVMELDQKVAVLNKVRERIAELYPAVDNPVRTELMSIVGSIKSSVNDNRLWEDFKLYFELNNPNFLLQLVKKHPELTPIDLKYCCYLKMNMSNDDIRNLLGINQESVRTHKYRLKKKMFLRPEEDLRAYLNGMK